MIGQKFGELTVTERTDRQASDGTYYWKCKCSCGNTNYTVSTTELRRVGKRAKKHCNNTIHLVKDLTGQQIGYLKIIKLDEASLKNGKVKYYCKCTRCNRDDLVLKRSNDLVSGKTRTCGCGCSFSIGAEKH